MARKVKSWQALLLLCGLVLVALEIAFSAQGGICQSEGCKAVAASPFTRLYGVPLTWFGAAFFAGALLLLPTRRPFALLLCLGVGAGLYFVFLQVVVLETICQFCIAVEGVIFATFLVGLRSKDTRKGLLGSTLAVLIGFLGVHAAYTLPLRKGGTEVCPLERGKVASWEGRGSERVQFFFDPQCGPCGEVFRVLKEHRGRFARVVFRCVAIRPGSEPLALAFYTLVLDGTDPWEAFQTVHGGASPGISTRPEAREMLSGSLALFRELGLEAVPAMLVMGEGGKVLVGRSSIEEHLAGEASFPTLELVPDICNPSSGC